jgi:hypothetical protein
MFGWAVEQTETKVKSNPMRDIKPIKAVGKGFYPWSMSCSKLAWYGLARAKHAARLG